MGYLRKRHQRFRPVRGAVVKVLSVLLPCSFALPCLAQTTCFTNPHGTTLCSTPDGVIQGTTNSIGQSTYRDSRGNLLDYDVDQFGSATVQPATGETIDWSQSAPAEREDPPPSGPGAIPLPGAAPLPGQHFPPTPGLPGLP